MVTLRGAAPLFITISAMHHLDWERSGEGIGGRCSYPSLPYHSHLRAVIESSQLVFILIKSWGRAVRQVDESLLVEGLSVPELHTGHTIDVFFQKWSKYQLVIVFPIFWMSSLIWPSAFMAVYFEIHGSETTSWTQRRYSCDWSQRRYSCDWLRT